MGGGGGPVLIQLDDNGNNPKGTKFFGTLSSIIKAFWGAGTLALPLLFKEGGAVSTTLFLWSLAGIALYAIFCLAKSADLIILTESRQNMITRIKRERYGPTTARALPFEVLPGCTDAHMTKEDKSIFAPTYAEVGNVAFGPWGGFLVDIALAICQIGICTAYVIFISSNFQEAIGGPSRLLWIFIIIGPVAAFLLISDLSKLSFVGLMGNIVYLTTICIIVYVGMKDFCCVPKEEINLNDFKYYPTIFGTCSFALEGIALMLPIKSQMHNPGKQFFASMSTAMFVVVLLYWGVGLGSYYMFGEATESPIIKSLPPSAIANIAKIALSLSIFFSFPFQFFPITDYIDKTLNRRYKVDPSSLTISRDYITSVENPPSCEDPEDDSQNSVNSAIGETASIDDIQPDPDQSVTFLPSSQQDSAADSSQTNIGTTIPDSYHTSEESIASAQQWSFKLSLIFRYLILALITIVAIVFPDFKLIIALFGSFANSSLAFIFPTLFWISIIAKGHRHIVNTTQYYQQLALSPWNSATAVESSLDGLSSSTPNLAEKKAIFSLTHVYFHDRLGKPIDVDAILQNNLVTINTTINSSSATSNDNATGVTTRASSYGSFDEDKDDQSSGAKTNDSNSNKVCFSSNDQSHLLSSSSSSKVSSTYGKIETGFNMIFPIPLGHYEFIFGWVAFPLCVAVVGIIASGIGVVDAMKDIIEQFSKK